MDDRFNTFSGWALGALIVAFGLSSVSSHYFEADKNRAPDKMGYEIEGVVRSGGGDEAEAPIETFLANADLTKGEAVFKKCTSCHTVNQGGANGIGPNLYGVVGEKIAGDRGGFPFSEALKSHGGAWDWKNLSDWLHNPKAFAPGTKMTFAGLSSAEDRANLIAWLNAQGSNLPLPAAPAAEAPVGGEGATAPNAVSNTTTTPAAAGAVAAPAPGASPAPAQDKSTSPQ
jgi:cytochrome c